MTTAPGTCIVILVTKSYLSRHFDEADMSGLVPDIFVTQADTWTASFEDYLRSLGCVPDEEPEYRGCECEIDYNCGCGRFGGYTWIETRYQGEDDGDPVEVALRQFEEIAAARSLQLDDRFANADERWYARHDGWVS